MTTDHHNKRGRPPKKDKAAKKLTRVGHDVDFNRKNSEAKDGEKDAALYAGAEWDAENGEVLTRARLESEAAEETYRQAKVMLDEAVKILKGTAKTLRMNQIRGGTDADKSVPFKEFEFRDKVIIISTVTLGSVLLVLGWINVAVTILGSGNPAFLEAPILAWLLGAIVPSAAMALKFGQQIFTLDSHKRLYAWVIYCAAGFFLVTWVILFANSFHGIAGGIDWDTLGEDHGGGTASLLVMVQILGEVTIGAALFMIADQIFTSYSSFYIVDNPAFKEAEQSVVEVKASVAVALEARIDAIAKFHERQSAREVFIQQAIADWRSLQRDS